MKSKTIALFVALVFQFSILVGVYVFAAIPLWTGTEIKLKTVPLDPRSMFRGNYVQLRYDISEIDAKYLPGSEELRNGEIVYVSLKPGNDGLFEFSQASLNMPDDGVYLRGRVEDVVVENLQIEYGIEAFFAPEDKALDLEKKLMGGGVAVIMVGDNGRARLKDVAAQP